MDWGGVAQVRSGRSGGLGGEGVRERERRRARTIMWRNLIMKMLRRNLRVPRAMRTEQRRRRSRRRRRRRRTSVLPTPRLAAQGGVSYMCVFLRVRFWFFPGTDPDFSNLAVGGGFGYRSQYGSNLCFRDSWGSRPSTYRSSGLQRSPALCRAGSPAQQSEDPGAVYEGYVCLSRACIVF